MSILSKSIAVLPFSNLSNVIENEYFSDGITEEIINALTKVKGLKVTAKTSSFAFKNKHVDVREIGEQLGVSTVLEGSVRFYNNKIRISTHLIRTDNGFHLWSSNFNRDLIDIFDLQDEISLLIAENIREQFGHLDIAEHLATIDTRNVKAYKLYLQAKHLRHKWNTDDVAKATAFLTESITIDNQFSEAYFELGWCYGMQASWGYIPKAEGLEKANYYIEKGLVLNPESYLGYYAKATISFWGYWNYKDTLHYLEKSLALNPNFSEVYNATTDLYCALGLVDKALEENKKGLQVDPLSVNHHFTKGNLLYFKGDFNKAIQSFDKALELNASFALAIEMKAAALILSKQEQEFKEFLKTKPILEKPETCKDIYNLMHNVSVFNIENREVNTNTNYNDTAYISLRLWNFYLQIYLGNHELALNILKQKIDQRSGQIFNFKNDPFIEPLRKYSVYKHLEKEVFSKKMVPVFKNETVNIAPAKPLNKTEIACYTEKLKEVFIVNKVYLNTNLTLKVLAETINLHPNKLSWLLNVSFNQNFNDFVNSYRLTHFKEIAVNPKNTHITILGLAYDSGFNSKSVFNTFFKKEEDITPSKWLKNQF